jgi:anti-anti-sigma regulatory factor
MTGKVISCPGLHFILDEKSEETIVYCSGQITIKSAQWLEQEIRARVIPVSRGKGITVTSRIMLDLSDVSHVDNAGLGSLFALWTAGQRACCQIEIHNFGVRSKSGALTRLVHRVIAQIQDVLWNLRSGESLKGQPEPERQARSAV